MTQTRPEILGRLKFKQLKLSILILVLVLACNENFGQNKVLKNTRISTTTGIIVSSNGSTPILLRNLQYGTIPYKSQIVFFSGSVKKDYDSLYTIGKKLNKFGFGYEIEPHINVGKVNQFLLPQAYIKARYGAVEFYVGRKKEIQGLVDTTGTMGSYIWSGNALPLPKLDISIPKFRSITKNGLIAVKGNYAHGWFGDGDSVKNFFLHQKSFYGRLGKPNWKIKIIAGFNHQVQWGGRPAVPYKDKISNNLVTTFGNDFPTYIKAVTGIAVNRNQDGINSGINSNDALNRVGNHLGTVDIGAEISTSFAEINVYRQSIYEDGSLFYLSNISDGLSGISIKLRNNKIFQKFTFEYLDTRNQGGGVYLNEPPELRGVDNYFGNSIYKDSWIYKGYILGSPLFRLMKEQGFSFGSNNPDAISSSRIKSINFSINYKFKMLTFKSQTIKCLDLGNYFLPQNYQKLFMLQSISFGYKSFKFSGDFNLNLGQSTENVFGINFKATKIWK